MKKQNHFELPSKKYNTEFRQIRKIWNDPSYQLLLLKHLTNRKKYICIKKHIQNDNQLFTLMKDIQIYTIVNEIKGINKFVWYSVVNDGNKKNYGRPNVMLIYQFGECTLEQFIRKNNRSFHKKQSIGLVKKLTNCVFELLCAVERNKKIDMNYVFFEHQLILVNHYGQVHQEIKFCYFPFAFIKDHKIKYANFHQFLYSSRELRLLNRQNVDRPAIPAKLQVKEIILQSQRQNEVQCCNSQILQKVGLCLLKSFFLFCQEIQVQDNHFQFYCMNEQFDVDFNWTMIEQYLTEYEQLREYTSIGQQLRFMLQKDQEENSFQEYKNIVQEIRVGSSSKKNSQPSQVKQPEHYIKIMDVSPDKKSSQHHLSVQNQPFQENTIFSLPKLRQIEFKLSKLKTQDIFYEDGSKYKGQLQNGQRQGLGIYTFAEGDTFAGSWKNGSMEGTGYYYFTNGQSYEGQIEGGVKQGYGAYFYKNGDFYKGMWKNDLKQGTGEFYCSATQQLYKGTFKNNFKDGKGTIYYKNNQKFEGNFHHNFKNGQGYYLTAENRIFQKAKWKNDVIVGVAETFMQNNDYYIGEMLNNKKHGRGIYKYNDGTVYEGQFVQDKQSGKCVIRYPNEDFYEGQIKDGLFEGYGKYYYKESDLFYEGLWKNGVQNGKGTYIYQKNVKVEAMMRERQVNTFNISSISTQ